MAGENFKTIRKYFSDDARFVIPNYQRGYKWGVPDKRGNAVEVLINALIEAYIQQQSEYFIQGVTVCNENSETILIDGQQRTTTFFLLLNELLEEEEKKLFLMSNNSSKIKLKYDIREDSQNFLMNLLGLSTENVDEDIQDIFYFKEAIKTIKNCLKILNEDKTAFKNYVLNNVNLVYISIDESKATKVFSMLNSNKAEMTQEELIKSALLSKSSRANQTKSINIASSTYDILKEKIGEEWEINALRSRYAREWDKWLYWWNRKEVAEFFKTYNKPMGLLLQTFFELEKEAGCEFSFKNFQNEFLKSNGVKDAKQNAKKTFYELHKLQKTFEEWFETPQIYNHLGLAFVSNIPIIEVITFFKENTKNANEIERYAKWALIGCTNKEIREKNLEKYQEKVRNVFFNLNAKYVYQDEEGEPAAGKQDAYKQLLRMNVQLIKNQKFDFTHFATKSLEHICPQNPTDLENFKESKQDIEEKSDGIHSIGNLVLLTGSANSKLSNHSFVDKKNILFNEIKKGFFLPHTLQVFSKSFDNQVVESLFDTQTFWVSENVNANKKYFITEYKNYYDGVEFPYEAIK